MAILQNLSQTQLVRLLPLTLTYCRAIIASANVLIFYLAKLSRPPQKSAVEGLACEPASNGRQPVEAGSFAKILLRKYKYEVSSV